ncbi:MAG: hypothetical protein WBA74_24650, partial [Cyclobacteriaceae bacterium]
MKNKQSNLNSKKVETKKTIKPYVRPNPNARQPMVVVVCGQMGIGKSRKLKMIIKDYLRTNPTKGKKGRKVLAFDSQDDDYIQFRSIDPDQLHKFNSVSARRIRPYNNDGSVMTINDRKETLAKMLRNFRNGLMIVDDIDDYMAGAMGQQMIGSLTTVR